MPEPVIEPAPLRRRAAVAFAVAACVLPACGDNPSRVIGETTDFSVFGGDDGAVPVDGRAADAGPDLSAPGDQAIEAGPDIAMGGDDAGDLAMGSDGGADLGDLAMT